MDLSHVYLLGNRSSCGHRTISHRGDTLWAPKEREGKSCWAPKPSQAIWATQRTEESPVQRNVLEIHLSRDVFRAVPGLIRAKAACGVQQYVESHPHNVESCQQTEMMGGIGAGEAGEVKTRRGLGEKAGQEPCKGQTESLQLLLEMSPDGPRPACGVMG